MSTAPPIRAGLYARVSTTDQSCENQLLELRRYCEARGWTACEYTDAAVSGAKTSRPALDQLLADAAKRRIDVVVCWRLDRLGRNLRHLVVTIEDLAAIDVGFISLGENIDTTSPTGRLLLGVLGSFAQFERERIRERVVLGLHRARRQGKRLGRRPHAIADATFETSPTCRCVTRRPRSASAARLCIGGGCPRNPSKRAPPAPRNPQRFRRSRRERGCHADS